MSKEIALGCTCGDCLHWEIISKVGSFIGTEPVPITLKCRTCGHKFSAAFAVNGHEKLTEVEIAA